MPSTSTSIEATRPTPDQFATATWDDIAPLYDALAERPLEPGDTADPAKEEAYLRFTSQIGPKRAEQVVRLANKLLDTGYTRDDLASTLRRFRTDRDLFRAESIPLEQELSTLNARYNKRTGGMTVEWEGTEIPLPRLNPFMLDPDRTVRERAFRLQFQPYLAHREELADIFDEQLAKRQQVARNAGFENYRDYIFPAKHRYDYTPEDCFTFHRAVEQTFVPAIGRRLEARRKQMGLDALRPWDTGVDPEGRPALRPYADI